MTLDDLSRREMLSGLGAVGFMIGWLTAPNDETTALLGGGGTPGLVPDKLRLRIAADSDGPSRRSRSPAARRRFTVSSV